MNAKVGYLASVVTLTIFMASCTTQVKVRPDGAGPFSAMAAESARAGIDYGLPMLQFKLNVKSMLSKCQKDDGTPEVAFTSKVTAEPHYVVGERFVVDYQALSSWTKVSAFELATFDNGAIKSINASAEDQTAAIIGDVVKTGVSIASLASGVPLTVSGGGNASQQPPGDVKSCSPDTVRTLKDIEATADALDGATKALTKLTDLVARLERSASINAITDEDKVALKKAQDNVVSQMKVVKKLDASLTELSDRVTVSGEILWPNTSKDRVLAAQPSPKNAAALMALFVDDPAGVPKAKITEAMNLVARIEETVGNPPQDSQDKNKLSESESWGILYRAPIPARLLVCNVQNVEDCKVGGASSVIVSNEVMAPQLAPLRLLPYSSGAFQNNSLKVTFRENGSVATFGYDEKASRAKALSGSVESALASAVAYRDAREADKDKAAADAKAEEAATEKAKLDKLDAEISFLEKTKKLEELKKPAEVPVDADAAVKAETARLNAQLAMLEAKKKVRDAEEALAKAAAP